MAVSVTSGALVTSDSAAVRVEPSRGRSLARLGEGPIPPAEFRITYSVAFIGNMTVYDNKVPLEGPFE